MRFKFSSFSIGARRRMQCVLAVAVAVSSLNAVAQVPGTLKISGNYSYSVNFSSEVVDLAVDRISNSSTTYTSGTLQLELWATTGPYSGGGISGYQVAKYRITGNTNGQLPPNTYFQNVAATVPIASRPPSGAYYATLILSEYSSTCTSSDKFCIVDYENFTSPMNVPVPVPTIIPQGAAGDGGGGGLDSWLVVFLLMGYIGYVRFLGQSSGKTNLYSKRNCLLRPCRMYQLASGVVSVLVVNMVCAAERADSCQRYMTEARVEPNLKARLERLRSMELCIDSTMAQLAGQTLATTDTDSEVTTASVAALIQQKVEVAKASAETQAKIDFKNDLGFSIGVGYSIGRGPDRVDDAEVVNGIVRVKKQSTNKTRIFLQLHQYLFSSEEGDWGTGPFASVQSGGDDVISSFGIGWMYGIRDKSASPPASAGWNIGVGYLWDADSKVLGDGIVANQALPVGETEVRYKSISLGSLFIVFARQF